MHSTPPQPTARAGKTAPQDTAGLLLPPGYLAAIDPATGQIVAVPVQDTPSQDTTGPAPTAFEQAQKHAAQQPLPLPAAPVPAAQGLPPAIAQAVVLGSIAMLAAGGASWMLGEAVHTAGPELHDVATVLRWLVWLIAAVVVAVVAAKVRTRTSGNGTTVNALFHTTRTTTIGRQSAGWKGTITNRN